MRYKAVSSNFDPHPIVLTGKVGGPLRSSNSGETWQVIQFPAPSPVISALVIFPDITNDHPTLAATAEDGALVSPDGGNIWHAMFQA